MGDIFTVANGGIRTHPASGCEGLNLDTMQPNLTYLDLNGRLLNQFMLEPEQRLNSIQHLA